MSSCPIRLQGSLIMNTYGREQNQCLPMPSIISKSTFWHLNLNRFLQKYNEMRIIGGILY